MLVFWLLVAKSGELSVEVEDAEELFEDEGEEDEYDDDKLKVSSFGSDELDAFSFTTVPLLWLAGSSPSP